MTPLMQRFSLEGKKALVTGASRGIGRTMALALAEAGAYVILCGRNQETLDKVVAEIAALGGVARARVLDVTDTAAITALFRDSGKLDILVNNAGMEQVCPSAEVGEDLWDKIMATNLKSAFFCAREAVSHMGQGGVILNTCSLTSEVGVPTAVPYTVSKSGLAGMTRALSAEWAAQGIRVVGIGPGYFETDLTAVFYEDEAWCESMQQKIPMGRFGAQEDLAAATVFLCSDAASYITGQILYVDGGYLASI